MNFKNALREILLAHKWNPILDKLVCKPRSRKKIVEPKWLHSGAIFGNGSTLKK